MPCTLTVVIVTLDAPTTPGGWGQVVFTLSGAVDTVQYAEFTRLSDGVAVQGLQTDGNGTYTLPMPPASVGTPLRLTVYEDVARPADGCEVVVELTVPGFAVVADPSLAGPRPWQPVGGVLPNPIALPIEAQLLDFAGNPRPGLYAEVELLQAGATVAFASFRATVRQAAQTVDAAPYLRSQLRAALTYGSPLSQPRLDGPCVVPYTYRYRIGDRQTLGAWQARAGVRYAVLAALPGVADTMQPFVADGAGRVASIFPSGEATQFVGLPLEVAVLLPAPTPGQDRYAEWRYLDGYGRAVEIRSLLLPDGLEAGLLRLPLPPDPPVVAATVEVAIVDEDRSFSYPGPHVTPPIVQTSGTYQDPLYGTY